MDKLIREILETILIAGAIAVCIYGFIQFSRNGIETIRNSNQQRAYNEQRARQLERDRARERSIAMNKRLAAERQRKRDMSAPIKMSGSSREYNKEYRNDISKNIVQNRENVDISNLHQIRLSGNEKTKEAKNIRKFYLRSMQQFSSLSKDEILSKRIEAVKNSPIFFLPQYTPNMKVFNFKDRAQWISAHQIACNSYQGNKSIGNGNSADSTGILNPELLFYIGVPDYGFSARYRIQCSDYFFLRPYKAYYNETDNTIYVYINMNVLKQAYRKVLGRYADEYQITLIGTNARDLGYNVAITNVLNNKNIRHANFSSKYQEKIMLNLQDSYMINYDCAVSGGCNTFASASVESKQFYITGFPAELHINLYDNNKADMPVYLKNINYVMIFEDNVQ